MINPGKYNKLIEIIAVEESFDKAGFSEQSEKTVLKAYAVTCLRKSNYRR